MAAWRNSGVIAGVSFANTRTYPFGSPSAIARLQRVDCARMLSDLLMGQRLQHQQFRRGRRDGPCDSARSVIASSTLSAASG